MKMKDGVDDMSNDEFEVEDRANFEVDSNAKFEVKTNDYFKFE
jgi:hypothetical protein